jgi:hypothetical protein
MRYTVEWKEGDIICKKKDSKISKHINNKRKIRTNVGTNTTSNSGLQCVE